MGSTSGIRPEYIIGFVIAIAVLLVVLMGCMIVYSNYFRKKHQRRRESGEPSGLEGGEGVHRAPEETPEGVTEALPSYTPRPAGNNSCSLAASFVPSWLLQTPVSEPPPTYQSTLRSHFPTETRIELPPPVYHVAR